MEWRLLEGVPDSDVHELLRAARRRHFQRGEVVFHRDDPADSLHLIVKGRFALRVMTPLGDIATIAIRGPGDSFGEMAVVARSARSATVAALEDAETFAIYERDFHALRRRYGAIDAAVTDFLVREIRMLNDRLLEALYVPVERRVCRRLCELVELYPTRDGVTEVPLTQEALAELAGTSRATVNRILNEEQVRGTLTLRRGRTVVTDSSALARRAR